MPVYPPPVHALSDVLCTNRCMRLADGWLEGVPYCALCVMVVIDRDAAEDLNPYMRFPELDDV